MADVAAKFGDLFDESGARVTELLVGHDEDGFDLRLQVAVHQGHIELKFKIREGAQPADDGISFLSEGEIDEQAAENYRADVGQLNQVGLEHREALLGREERALAGVLGHRDGDVIE